ncbi:putative quinol monooxygenase (plasmid) [Agrobacterium tumefaciens]|nr:putative quinol monooxygenase [Agrobacterium tumefaciens]
MDASQTIHLVAVLKAKPGKAEELRRRLEEIIPDVRKEPGCLAYNLHVDRSDGSAFVMLEAWESAAALDAHGSSAPFRSLQSHFDELLAEPLGLQLLSRLA